MRQSALIRRGRDWQPDAGLTWSSVRAHLNGHDDGLVVSVKRLLDRVGEFATLMTPDEPNHEAFSALRKIKEEIGRLRPCSPAD